MKLTKEFLSIRLMIIVIIGFTSSMLGCERGCFRNGAKRDARVEDCSIYNRQEDQCKAAMQMDGLRCRYDKTTRNCVAAMDTKEKSCDRMSMAECKASKFCTYKDATQTCGEADPALLGKCDVIQEKNACKNESGCDWNDTAVLCEEKK